MMTEPASSRSIISRATVLGCVAATVPVLAFWMVPMQEALPGTVLGWGLLAIADQDARTLTVPMAPILALVIAGVTTTAVLAPSRLGDHLLGTVAGLAGLAAIAFIYRRLRRRDGLGEGDAWLLGCAGSWVGWQGLPSVVLIAAASGLGAAVAGAALARRGLAGSLVVPFAPFLCLGTWLVWLTGPIDV